MMVLQEICSPFLTFGTAWLLKQFCLCISSELVHRNIVSWHQSWDNSHLHIYIYTKKCLLAIYHCVIILYILLFSSITWLLSWRRKEISQRKWFSFPDFLHRLIDFLPKVFCYCYCNSVYLQIIVTYILVHS